MEGTAQTNNNAASTAATRNNLLMNGTPFSNYNEFVKFLVDSVKFPSTSMPSSPSSPSSTSSSASPSPSPSLQVVVEPIPSEIARHIVSFFTIQKLDMSSVMAVRASSTSGQHPLQQCLVENDKTWWISGSVSYSELTTGMTWVEFSLGSVPRRVSSISIKIPPLPMGPFSVRTMRIDKQVDEGWEWTTASSSSSSSGSSSGSGSGSSDQQQRLWSHASPILTVANVSEWQEFQLDEPFDAQTIRLVCLSNQISQFVTPGTLDYYLQRDNTSVGFYTARFA